MSSTYSSDELSWLSEAYATETGNNSTLTAKEQNQRALPAEGGIKLILSEITTEQEWSDEAESPLPEQCG